ncbi:MAG: hypothetical protein WBA74_23510, partial [Cyclobacteriaceae bacterium]
VDKPTDSVQALSIAMLPKDLKRRMLSHTSVDNLTGNTTGQSSKVTPGTTGESGERRVSDEKAEGLSGEQRELRRRLSLIKYYVDALWLIARNALYANKDLTSYQVERAYELLYDWFLPVRDKDLMSVYREYSERILLVKRYISKDPQNRYVQLPDRYFDTSNPSGFTGTKKWYEAELARRKKIRNKTILSAQIKKFTHQKSISLNRQQNSSLEVFRECEQRLGKLKDSQIMEEFYAAVASNELYQKIYAKQQR